MGNAPRYASSPLQVQRAYGPCMPSDHGSERKEFCPKPKNPPPPRPACARPPHPSVSRVRPPPPDHGIRHGGTWAQWCIAVQ